MLSKICLIWGCRSMKNDSFYINSFYIYRFFLPSHFGLSHMEETMTMSGWPVSGVSISLSAVRLPGVFIDRLLSSHCMQLMKFFNSDYTQSNTVTAITISITFQTFNILLITSKKLVKFILDGFINTPNISADSLINSTQA